MAKKNKKKNKNAPSLFSNRKGALGISLDSLGNWIQGILALVPAPIKFLIFLFLLITLGYILSVVFNAFGVYCNSADQPVKLNSNLFANLGLIGNIPDPKDLGKEALSMEEGGITIISQQVTECSMELQEGYFVDSTGKKTNVSNQFFYDGTFCTDCQEAAVYSTAGSITNRVGGFTKKWCVGYVDRKEDKGLVQKALCGDLACEPPKHYRYDDTQNLYVCADQSCNGRTLGQAWDEALSEKGAALMYPDGKDERNPSSDNAVGITCTELKPKLAFYGLDLFRYDYWIVMLVIIILFWGLGKINEM